MSTQRFHIEKRRSGRIIQELLLRVAGTDAKGRDFLVQTRTIMLSRHGAQILLQHDLVPEQEISVYCPVTGKDSDARVVGLFTRESEGYSYGIEFLDDDVNFWNVQFPPAPTYPA